jgi:hypothetical protein
VNKGRRIEKQKRMIKMEVGGEEGEKAEENNKMNDVQCDKVDSFVCSIWKGFIFSCIIAKSIMLAV